MATVKTESMTVIKRKVKAPSIQSPTMNPQESKKTSRSINHEDVDGVAGSTVCYLDHKWPGAEKDFPVQPWFRSVSKYYPWAKGGALWVDEPESEEEKKVSLKKQEMMLARGLRCVVFQKRISFADMQMELERVTYELDNSTGKSSSAPVGRPEGQAPVQKKVPGNTGRRKQKV